MSDDKKFITIKSSIYPMIKQTGGVVGTYRLEEQGTTPFEMEVGARYNISKWDSTLYVKSISPFKYELINIYGSPFKEGEEYIVIKPAH